jgi:hypothetical protein
MRQPYSQEFPSNRAMYSAVIGATKHERSMEIVADLAEMLH